MSEADTKVRECQACGEDCTGKPRIKDKKGRYLHKACYEKAKSRTGNSVVGTAADPIDPVPVATRPFVMAEFLEDSFKLVAQSCPNCSHSMPECTLLCVHCGYNFHSGKTLKTIARVEETPKGERAG